MPTDAQCKRGKVIRRMRLNGGMILYLGFLTGCMGNIPLKDKVDWAAEQGLRALEISCWPLLNDRDYSSCDIDVENLTIQKAQEIKAYVEQKGLTISSLAYYDNNLAADLKHRQYINNHLYKVIDACVLLGVNTVGTFAGRNHNVSMQENFDQFEEVFKKVVRYAAERNIRVMIENCPMVGWQLPGLPGTISFSPELWTEMFKRVSDENFGLNYDPSHLRFMMMDYIEPVKEFADRIFHVHAKDVFFKKEILKHTGIYNKQLFDIPGESFWKPVMPGLGDVDFDKLIDTLGKCGYDGVVSIEHEDPDYEGSLEKVKEGLIIAINNLSKII